ncbi:MAG TPA: sulfatase-like hydrolase/transferase [Nevskiaceae bacterium]|nr:sulfatase-like hydrolase/transferase [Nevskiaceae bacterium]
MTNWLKKPLTRRDFTRGLALAGAAVATGTRAQAQALAKRKRPNILMIVSDQERGWPDLPTNLGLAAHDWLLEKGTGFTNYNVHTTPCSPSRSTLYTGLHTQFTGLTSNVGAPPFPTLSPDVKTIGHLMREQGYYTAYKGKWHLSDVPNGTILRYGPFRSARRALDPYGFADYSENGIADGATWTGYKFDGEVASSACQWLHDQGTTLDQPWLLAVNFVNPHDIVFFDDVDRQQSKTRLDHDYLSPLAPPPVDGVYTHAWDLPMPRSWYEDDLSTKPWAQRSYVDFCANLYGRIDRKDETRWRRYQSYYYNCIRDIDRHALTVLRTLEALGLADNTIVVYTSDHGDMLGAHGMRQKGPTMYKENVRVPFMVRHPDGARGVQTAALAGAMDVVPTLLAFAGCDDAKRAERYPGLKGHDLSAAVADPAARTRRDQRGHLYDYNTTLYIDPDAAKKVIADHEDASWWSILKAGLEEGRIGPDLDNPALFRGVHDGRYKFARYFRPSQHHLPNDWETLTKYNELELYDTQADPDEIVNLAREPEKHKALLLELNAKTNALILDEIGFDDGREHMGPKFLYTL